MSLDFDGVDDELNSSATQTLGTAISVACWFEADTEGENNQGVLFAHDPTGPRFGLRWNAGLARKLLFRSDWTSDGLWEMTTGFAALAGLKWVMATYDGASTVNDPILYTLVDSTFSILTVGSGLTETAAPSGSLAADTKTVSFGSAAGVNVTFDGRVGECALWKRILTAAEASAVAFLGVNAVPDHFDYLPLDGGSLQNLGSSGQAFATVGTPAVGANPPIRPAGRRG